MTNAGWYPDPGGAPGMLRYWDGQAWGPNVAGSPVDGAPPSQTPSSGGEALGRTPTPSPYLVAAPPPRRGVKGFGWWLLILVIVAALIFGLSQLLRAAGIDPLNPGGGVTNATINPCPPEPIELETPVPHPNDGRVHGGKLSYPLLGSPWSSPEGDQRLPFGRDVSVQQVMVEQNYHIGVNGKAESWVASILVGEMMAGDGFIGPKEGAELLTLCSIKTFYSDAVVQRNDKSSSAVTVDGHAGWMIETHLTFDIPGLQVKGETAIFVVVQTSAISSSLYYASIPDSVPELLTTARKTQTQLRVDP